MAFGFAYKPKFALQEGKSDNQENNALVLDPMNVKQMSVTLIDTKYLARDVIADLAKRKFVEYYKMFSETEFTWDRTGGDPITQGNRNPLLYKNLGADGIKTGYLAVEKYSLASSLKKNGRRLIAVGSGFETKNSRSRESTKLLTYGITNFDLIEIAKAKKSLDKVDVWLGKEKQVNVYVNEDIYKTIKKAQKRLLKVSINYNGPVEAPIKKNQIIGKLNISYNENIIGEYDLLAANDVKKVNIFSRLMKSINYLIWGDV